MKKQRAGALRRRGKKSQHWALVHVRTALMHLPADSDTALPEGSGRSLQICRSGWEVRKCRARWRTRVLSDERAHPRTIKALRTDTCG